MKLKVVLNLQRGNLIIRETKNPGVLCAKVVEVGVDCKAVTEGCDVYVPAAVLKPVVINDKTYFIVFEENLLLIFE